VHAIPALHLKLLDLKVLPRGRGVGTVWIHQKIRDRAANLDQQLRGIEPEPMKFDVKSFASSEAWLA
jgi:hypothetical protein